MGLTALLFPVLSAVGIISLNERILQNRRVAAKLSKRKGVKVSNNVNLTLARQAKKSARLDALVDFYETNPNARATEAAQSIGVSRQTVYTYVAELEEAGASAEMGKM